MPAWRLIVSELAPANPTRANSSAAARSSRSRWSGRRTSSGGAWRPRAEEIAELADISDLERTAVVVLVVIAIGAGTDRLPPPGIVAVPLHGPRQSLVEADLGLPAQPLELVGRERVTPVVTGAVGHILDQRLV